MKWNIVNEYVNEFLELLIYVDEIYDEKVKFQRFLSGFLENVKFQWFLGWLPPMYIDRTRFFNP